MKKTLIIGMLFLGVCVNTTAQITERPRPKEWSTLVDGARFIDRFNPLTKGLLSSDTWGAKGVIPRYVDNGIEDRERSYWGGNILQDKNGLFHLFVCGWKESSLQGHHEWPNSIVYHTTSKSLSGPYAIQDTIGHGHNPEIFQTDEGKYVLYVIGTKYTSNALNGPWTKGNFEFDKRDRPIIEGLSNLTFAKREDGSFLMICRGGGVWFSQTGDSLYMQVSDKRVYPPVAGEFEDPVVWRDHIQYHLIVNDWLGRIAFYLRSKDGVTWVTDPGEAYTQDIVKHADGRTEDWFKLERIKVFQDKYGRAIQANFAAIDVLKNDDLPNDNHSSKNIMIPLNPGLLISMIDQKMPTEKTKTIQIKIQAEEGFNPHTDIDIESLRFGASSEVNFGRGSHVLNTKISGKDLIVIFDAKGHGITKDEFAPKLIGKSSKGKLLYGYTRVPWIDYIEPILSARKPVLTSSNGGIRIETKIENFGQIASKSTKVRVVGTKDGVTVIDESAKISPVNPFGETTINLFSDYQIISGEEYEFTVSFQSDIARTSSFKVILK